jgi:hypothetical protein
MPLSATLEKQAFDLSMDYVLHKALRGLNGGSSALALDPDI